MLREPSLPDKVSVSVSVPRVAGVGGESPHDGGMTVSTDMRIFACVNRRDAGNILLSGEYHQAFFLGAGRGWKSGLRRWCKPKRMIGRTAARVRMQTGWIQANAQGPGHIGISQSSTLIAFRCSRR